MSLWTWHASDLWTSSKPSIRWHWLPQLGAASILFVSKQVFNTQAKPNDTAVFNQIWDMQNAQWYPVDAKKEVATKQHKNAMSITFPIRLWFELLDWALNESWRRLSSREVSTSKAGDPGKRGMCICTSIPKHNCASVTKQAKQKQKQKHHNNKTWPFQPYFVHCCPPPPNFHRLQQRWTQGAIDLPDRDGSFIGLQSYRQSLTIMHSPYVCLNK